MDLSALQHLLGLAPGLYALQVQAGESQTRQKLLVE